MAIRRQPSIAVNRWRYKTPYAISTVANEPSWERVWAALQARLPGIPIEPE